MTGREIVIRNIQFDRPPRFAYDFLPEDMGDILHVHAARLVHPAPEYKKFGHYPALAERLPDFDGELRIDVYGNLCGRFNGKTKGECILGALQMDFDAVGDYQMPALDDAFYPEARAMCWAKQDKFVLAGMPVAIFSTLRDLRLMHNALTDTLLETENVAKLMDKITQKQVEIIERASSLGVDAMMIGDDWGTQDRLFIRPESFRELFKPVYKRLGDALHAHNMKFFMHSCGYIVEIIEDLIDAGVDVFQFDQPELAGSEALAQKLSGRAALYSPVDVQKIMPTGDLALIEDAARRMTSAFRAEGGGLVMKDYPSWGDIDVRPEWADHARAALVRFGDL